MNTPSSDSALALIHGFVPWIFQMYEQTEKEAYKFVWNSVFSFVASHLILTLAILIGLPLFAYVDYLIGHRWAFLGRVLYLYVSGGIVVLIGWILGPEIYANIFFDIALVLIGVFSYRAVGEILIDTGIRKRRTRR